MSYGNKYRFRFDATNGVEYNIYIKKKNFSGTCLQRALGGAPLLRRDVNGHICGTSLTIIAECSVDQEFASLYTSDAREYLVELYAGATLIWTGFVSPELYSEPDIAPPYNVSITATDGLGELKIGTLSESDAGLGLFYTYLNDLILPATGLSIPLTTLSGMRTENCIASDFMYTAGVNIRHLVGSTYYEVLEAILSALNANITQYNGSWLLWRETDAVADAGHTTLTWASGGSKSLRRIGSAATYGTWPIGQMETEIQPAKNKIIVQCPNFYCESVLRDPEFKSTNVWTGQYGAAQVPVGTLIGGVAVQRQYYSVPAGGPNVVAGRMYQTLSSLSYVPASKLILNVMAVDSDPTRHDLLVKKLTIGVQAVVNGTTYSLSMSNDGSSIDDYSWSVGSTTFQMEYSLDERTDKEIYLPQLAGASQITFTFYGAVGAADRHGADFRVYGAYLSLLNTFTGVQINLALDNNARNEEDPVELKVSNFADTTATDILNWQYGIIFEHPSSRIFTPALEFSSTKLAEQNYIAFIAMDMALQNALPRIRKKGTVNVPSAAAAELPFAFYDGSTDYIVDTWEYDLLNSEVSLEMISLPAATLTVDSSTITSLPEGNSTNGTTGGTSSGGSAVVSGWRIEVVTSYPATLADNTVYILISA